MRSKDERRLSVIRGINSPSNLQGNRNTSATRRAPNPPPRLKALVKSSAIIHLPIHHANRNDHRRKETKTRHHQNISSRLAPSDAEIRLRQPPGLA